MSRSRRLGVPIGVAATAIVLGVLLWWMMRPASDERQISRPTGASEAVGAAVPGLDGDPVPGDLVRFESSERQPLVPVQAEPTASTATAGSLTVHVRWKADGSPAAGIGLRLLQIDRPDAQYHAIEGTSDGRGDWSLKDVLPGRVIVYSDRIEGQAGVIIAGRASELVVELLPGVLVTGTVVDPDGQVVPGAEVWLDDGYTPAGAIKPVGRADNAGRFNVVHVRRGQSVGASAPGYTRSASIPVHDDSPDPFEVQLEVGPPGGGVRGIVVDPEGTPVTDATVLVGGENGWPLPRARQSNDLGWSPPYRVVTDERGEFLAEDVPVGSVEVAVRATGWSPWAGSAESQLGQTATVHATLQPSASVSGTVRDAAGQPLGDVHVGTGEGALMRLQYAFSEADGRFTLRDLPLGRNALAAFKDGGGRAETVLTIEAGGRYEWDPVLARGNEISGRILDTRRDPAPGYRVEGVPEAGEARKRQTVAKAGGRFTLTNCEDIPYRIDVYPPELSGLAVASVSGIRPGQPEAEIIVTPGIATASVVGRVQDPAGLPVKSARIGLYQSTTKRGMAVSTDPATGRFVVGPFPPGRYLLFAEAEGFPDLTLRELELGPGEVRDLGAIVFAASATIVVRVAVPEGIAAASVRAFLGGLGGAPSAQPERQPDGSLLSPPLVAGEYRLEVWAQGAMTPDRTVRVEGGQRLELDVALVNCAPHSIELSMPLREGPAPEVVVEIRNRDASIVIEKRPQVSDQAGELTRRTIASACLPPGDYTLRVHRDGQLVLDVPLVEADASKQPGRWKFELP